MWHQLHNDLTDLDQGSQLVQWKPNPAGPVGCRRGAGGGAGGGLAQHPEEPQTAKPYAHTCSQINKHLDKTRHKLGKKQKKRSLGYVL